MRGRAQTLEIGPWTGGLNYRSDPFILGDDELAVCENLFMDVDGSLQVRPVAKEVTNVPEYDDGFGVTQSTYILGSFTRGIHSYLVVSGADGVYAVRTSLTGTEQWTLLKAHSAPIWRYTCMAIYRDVLYISGPAALDRFRVDLRESENFAVTVDNTIPPAHTMIAFKGRIFARDNSHVSRTSRLIYSNVVTDVATWDMSGSNWNNFIDINPQQGDDIMAVANYNDDLLILKRKGVYLLVYDDLIANAFVRQISDSVGAGDRTLPGSAHFLIVSHQNITYVLADNYLYELSGYNFIELNVKVPFTHETTTLSVFGDLLAVRINAPNHKYFLVYNPLTKTWSKWLYHVTANGSSIDSWVTVQSSSGQVIYGANGGSGLMYKSAFNREELSQPALWDELFAARFRTKIFNFNDKAHYKKLVYWLLYMLAPSATITSSSPNVYMRAYVFDGVNFPWNESGYVEETLYVPEAITAVTAKALKTLRFKQIAFEVVQEGTFTNVTRSRFYSISALVSQKQTYDKKGN